MKRKYIETERWGRLELNTPEEEAAINAGIAADPDTYELTDEEMALLKPMNTPINELHGVKGRPKAEVTKERISIRLAPEVTEYFRATGKGWQTRMGDVLKEYVEEHS